MFVQVQQRWRRLFFGICMGNGFHASYEMAHLKNTPPQCQNISGLVDVFKSKLVSYAENLNQLIRPLTKQDLQCSSICYIPFNRYSYLFVFLFLMVFLLYSSLTDPFFFAIYLNQRRVKKRCFVWIKHLTVTRAETH